MPMQQSDEERRRLAAVGPMVDAEARVSLGLIGAAVDRTEFSRVCEGYEVQLRDLREQISRERLAHLEALARGQQQLNEKDDKIREAYRLLERTIAASERNSTVGTFKGAAAAGLGQVCGAG